MEQAKKLQLQMQTKKAHVTDLPSAPSEPTPTGLTGLTEPTGQSPPHQSERPSTKSNPGPGSTKYIVGGFVVGFGYVVYRLWKKYRPQTQTVSKKLDTPKINQELATLPVTPKPVDPFFMQ